MNSNHDVVGVVTALDRPRGRGQLTVPTHVASRAEALGLPVLKLGTLKSEESHAAVTALNPDAIVVVAFGLLVPLSLLEFPPHGCINLHPSLLPRYRGASPIHAPLLAGETETGISTMYMDQGLDTGDIIIQEKVSIRPEWHAGDLHDALAVLGAALMVRTLDQIEAGTAPRRPQENDLASYAPKVGKEAIDWSSAAEAIVRRVRGLSPFPGVHTGWEGRRIKVLRAYAAAERRDDGPLGSVVGVDDEGIRVATSQGLVVLTELQPEGKKPMSAGEFARGYRIARGTRLS